MSCLARARVSCWVAIFLWTATPSLALALPAFDGAEGFGSTTTHARGTGVCIVDNLLDADQSQTTKYLPPGSLRYCLAEAQESGGRYVVFDTSGTINLRRPALVPSNTYIAGQTSAGGIAIEGQALFVKNAEDVVIRHIRHRESRQKADAFNIVQSRNVVIDHVSISFFKDGAIDIVDGSTDITVQWSHMGDAIESGSTNERYHGQPNLLRSDVDRISLHHNLYTHGHTRMPLVQHTVASPVFLIEFSNNVVYNYGKYPSRFAAVYGSGNVIGNYYLPGRNSHGDGAAGAPGSKGSGAKIHPALPPGARPPILVENGMSLFLKDNLMEDGVGHDAKNFTDEYGKQIETGEPRSVTSVRTSNNQPEARMVASARGKVLEEVVPFWERSAPVEQIPRITTQPARENFANVLKSFGAHPRDNTDKRLVVEVETRTGGWKYIKPDDRNSYVPRRIIDSDKDGLSDEFEARAGRDIQPVGHDLDSERDNIEIYLDELAREITP